MLATLARRGVHVDATLVAFQPAFFGDDPALLTRDRQYHHPEMVANWLGGFRFDLGWRPDDYRRARAVWPRVLRLTRVMYEAGVPMTIGTDQANPWVAPGISVSREMALHQQAGIPAWAVLRMATSDAARLLGARRTHRRAAARTARPTSCSSPPTRGPISIASPTSARSSTTACCSPPSGCAPAIQKENPDEIEKAAARRRRSGPGRNLAWTGAALALLLFDPTLAQWALIVTVAAVATEVALWIGVALLGFTALDRFRGWARLRRSR